jgi:hypothetical protein
MKAILEFSLPDDELSFEYAKNGQACYCVLLDFQEKLFQLKHDNLQTNNIDFYINEFNESLKTYEIKL